MLGESGTNVRLHRKPGSFREGLPLGSSWIKAAHPLVLFTQAHLSFGVPRHKDRYLLLLGALKP